MDSLLKEMTMLDDSQSFIRATKKYICLSIFPISIRIAHRVRQEFFSLQMSIQSFQALIPGLILAAFFLGWLLFASVKSASNNGSSNSYLLQRPSNKLSNLNDEIGGAVKKKQKLQVQRDETSSEAMRGLCDIALDFINDLSIQREELRRLYKPSHGVLYKVLEHPSENLFVNHRKKIQWKLSQFEKIVAGIERCLNADHLDRKRYLLNYGDYVGMVCKSYKQSPQWMEYNVLHGKLWSRIQMDLDEEARLKAKWQLGELPQTVPPATPVTKSLKGLAKDLGVSFEQMSFNIERYSERNNEVHASKEELVRAENWNDLAWITAYDLMHVEHDEGVPSEDIERWKQAIRDFEKLYFESIKIGPAVNGVWGGIMSYTLKGAVEEITAVPMSQDKTI
jgi:hypothetical protein